MTISYLTQQELNDTLSSGGHIDNSVITDVLTQLQNDGIYNTNPNDPTKTAWTQFGNYSSNDLLSSTQVLDITSTTQGALVNTDPSLKAIVLQTATPTQIYVEGSNSVYIGLGDNGDSINLYDTGNDTVQGGSGNDVIGGGGGNDVLMGGGGDDSIYGGQGPQTIIGGEGNNYLSAGSGSDLVEGGGSGNNTIVDYYSGTSTLMAGTGSDTIYGYGSDTVEGNSAGTGITELHGGINSDVISNSNVSTYNVLGSGSTNETQANTLQGGAGSDYLYGAAGNDSLYAGSGDQHLYAGTGAQLLEGGTGNDFIQDSVSGGHDTLTAGASGSDTIYGMQGDVFNSNGSTGNNIFWVEAGGSGNSTLTGGTGNDTFHIETQTGNDTVIGGGGDDVLGLGGRSVSEVQSITSTGAGSYQITFNDSSQVINVSGISDLYFAGDGQDIKLTP